MVQPRECNRIIGLEIPAQPGYGGRNMPFLDPDHPFFRRPATRWATALVPLGWGGLEALSGNPGWAILFGGAGAYAFWALIVKGPADGSQ
ncbi:MAG: hypothetical protein Q8P60_06080 [Pseudorhodobacter sp.]|nr:hypothetical protein [Pseudorhodobacter sp.]